MPMNVGNAITPAMEHTSRLLFKPFILRKWLALGLVALLAQIGGGGSAHANWPSDEKGTVGELGQQAMSWIVQHAVLVAAAFTALFLISLLLGWLASVFKFVYVHQITRVPLAIREPFHRYRGLGTSFFLWELAFSVVVLIALAVLVGLPWIAIIMTDAGTGAKIVVAVWSVLVGLPIIVGMILVSIYASDFVLATMFVREVRVLEAWRIVIPLLRANAGQSLLYIGMLIVISIVTGIGSALVGLVAVVAFLIPGGILGAIGYWIWSESGWSVATIAYTVVAGIPLVLAFIYATTCAVQPFNVFRRAYSLVVLGQADPSLATIPIPPTDGPRLMPEHGV